MAMADVSECPPLPPPPPPSPSPSPPPLPPAGIGIGLLVLVSVYIGIGIGIGILTLKETRAPCATEYRVFHRPADIQSLTGLQRPARRWMRRLGVRVHLRLLLQGALYVQGQHG